MTPSIFSPSLHHLVELISLFLPVLKLDGVLVVWLGKIVDRVLGQA